MVLILVVRLAVLEPPMSSDSSLSPQFSEFWKEIICLKKKKSFEVKIITKIISNAVVID